MAQPALDFFRKRGLIGKIEVTEGTDIVPVPGTDGILIMNGQSGTEFDVVERPIDRVVFTNDPFQVGNKRAFIEGEFELFPPAIPGTQPAACDLILRIGGMGRVYTVGDDVTTGKTRYNPISAAIPSASLYWYHVDYLKKVLGARAAISRLAMTISGRFSGQARMLGTYETVDSSALPAIVTYTDIPPIMRYNNSETWITELPSGTPLLVWAKELSIDLGSSLGAKEYTSKKVNSISDRRATFTLRIARTDLADFNPWALRDAGTLISAYIEHDNGSGLYAQLGIRGQIEQINEVDIDQDLGLEITGRCIASTSATPAVGDEFWVEFGDKTAAGTT